MSQTPSPQDIKENVKNYWNERSKTFDEDIGHGADETEREMWKRCLSEIMGTEPKRVLDVGTGTGMIALTLAELGHQVTGIDLGESMMAIARQKAAAKNLQVSFQLGDAEHPQFPDDTFDCIICRHLLWTLPDPDTAIREWVRVCTTGGKVIAIDGHTQPVDYFHQHTDSGESLSEQQKLWNQMYSAEVVRHLPSKESLTLTALTGFLSGLHMCDVQARHITEISEYHKKLHTEQGKPADHCEVNIIWGTVQKN